MSPVIRRGLVALAAAALLSACDLGTVVQVVDVASIELDPTSEPVQLGNTFQLQATATSAQGEPLSRDLDFASSNTGIATVSSSGLVTTNAPGTVEITASSGSASGTATIHSVPMFCPVTGTLRPGESGSGDVASGPCTVNDFFGDFWFLDITSEESVQIDLTSTDYDTFLIVYEWDGSQSFDVVDSNDDGGAGTNSRLTVTLSPGVYMIQATTFAPGASGSYLLTLS